MRLQKKNILPFKKILILSLLTPLAIFGGARLYFLLTDDLTQSNVLSEFAYREHFNIPSSSPSEILKVNQILDQTFSYIGKGAQTYAFASDDGKYVLKIVKQKHYKFSKIENLIFHLPFLTNLRQKKIKKKQRKIEDFLASCALCYQELPEETALSYLHLKKTKDLHGSIFIKDKLGISRKINLDHTEFMLQSKATLLTTQIKELMKNNDIKGAKQSLEKIYELLMKCWQKGIGDRDTHFINNLGFVNGKAIFIDVGEFFRDERFKNSEVHHQYLFEYSKTLNEWLQNHYPQLMIQT